jgi:hypothetical protein
MASLLSPGSGTPQKLEVDVVTVNEGRLSEVEVDVSDLLDLHNDRIATFESLRAYQNSLRNEIVESKKIHGWFRNTFKLWYITLLDIVAATYVYFAHTVNFEGFLVLCNSTAVTAFYLYYVDPETNTYLASRLDFSILSFSVVFPLTSLLQQAFTRREQSLMALGDLKALIIHIAMASLTWDFVDQYSKKYDGRSQVDEDFDERVLKATTGFLRLVYEFMSMPMVSRARHYVIPDQLRERAFVHKMQDKLLQQISRVMLDLYENVEELKWWGLPGNEAARINQYHWLLQQRFEILRNIKYYRTPQVTRSFGRFYIFALPWMFGPYFAYVGSRQIGDDQTNVGFAFALSGFTFLVLMGLINGGRRMEDPFAEEMGFDNVHLKHDLAACTQIIVYQYRLAEQKRKSRERAPYTPKRASASNRGGAQSAPSGSQSAPSAQQSLSTPQPKQQGRSNAGATMTKSDNPAKQGNSIQQNDQGVQDALGTRGKQEARDTLQAPGLEDALTLKLVSITEEPLKGSEPRASPPPRDNPAAKTVAPTGFL